MQIINIILVLQFTLIIGMNLTETTNKRKSILTKFINNRHARCSNFDKTERFVAKTIKLVEHNAGLDEFLKGFNVSQCSLDKSAEYVKRHILNGLIVHSDLPDWHWHEYKSVHKKAYATPHQELKALTTWRKNLQIVAQHNRDFLLGKQSYSLHLNLFGDLDVKEYFNKFLKLFHTFPLFDPAEDHHKIAYRKSLHRSVPETVDWRTKGFKPKLEEQQHCGACYAFAVTHALQAQLYRRHGFWGELSTQQIVDCSSKDGNAGCDGGSLRGALRYAARDGLVAESQYPYVGKDGSCKYNSHLVRVRARRWATLPVGDEAAIEKSLTSIGPLAVAVNAAPFTFQLYRSGIYDDLFCTSWTLNHAMLLVGYTQDYWILLNWWGKNWGEDGYIRRSREQVLAEGDNITDPVSQDLVASSLVDAWHCASAPDCARDAHHGRQRHQYYQPRNLYTWYINIGWIMFVLTLAAAIYGVTSWFVVKKFRHFRNYVLLSAIIANTLTSLLHNILNLYSEELVRYLEVYIIYTALLMYPAQSFNSWLLVLCYMFYVDYVKGFSSFIRRRYLTSSLLAWGVPLITILLLYVPTIVVHVYVSSEIVTSQILTNIITLMLLIPVAISFVIYIIVVYRLFRDSVAGVSTSFNKWRGFYIATLTFVLSNVIAILDLTVAFNVKSLTINVILNLAGYLNAIALSVYLIILRINQQIWREFLDTRSKIKFTRNEVIISDIPTWGTFPS